MKLSLMSSDLDFHLHFDLALFGLHFCWVFKLRGSFVTLCLFHLWTKTMPKHKSLTYFLMDCSVPDYFSNKTVRNSIFWLCMALKEVLSRPFNSFKLKTVNLYLETWLWLLLISAKGKSRSRGSRQLGLCENIS